MSKECIHFFWATLCDKATNVHRIPVIFTGRKKSRNRQRLSHCTCKHLENLQEKIKDSYHRYFNSTY